MKRDSRRRKVSRELFASSFDLFAAQDDNSTATVFFSRADKDTTRIPHHAIMAGLIARYTHWLHTQWPAGTVEKLPISGENGETSIHGVRIVGDLTRIPLLKFSSATGAGAVHAILKEEGGARRAEGEIFDLAIVGAGVAGISAAIEAK